MGGSKVSYPGPSAAEQQLQQTQSQLLRQQMALIQQGQQQQELIAPYLYEQMGLRPQYGPGGDIVGYERIPEYQAQQRLAQELLGTQLGISREQLAMQQQAQREQQLLAPILYQQMGIEPIYGEGGALTGFRDIQTREELAYEQAQAKQAEAERVQQLMEPYFYEQMGLRPQYGAEGQLTGFEKITDPLEQQRQDIERQYLERTQKALRGELPVDPTVTRELESQERTIRETLRRQLGPGWETSSAGQEALRRFGTQRAEVLAGASRGELLLSEQLGLARGAAEQQRQAYERGGLTGVGGYLAQLGAAGRSELPALAAGGVAAAQRGPLAAYQRAAQLASGAGVGGGFGPQQILGGQQAWAQGISQLAGMPFQAAQQLGGLYGGIGQGLETLGQWRGQQFQSQVAGAQSRQAQQQMYGGLAAAGVSATAMFASTAAGMAAFSSRRLKRDIRSVGPEGEQTLRRMLTGE
jgi:hypothetical protein